MLYLRRRNIAFGHRKYTQFRFLRQAWPVTVLEVISGEEHRNIVNQLRIKGVKINKIKLWRCACACARDCVRPCMCVCVCVCVNKREWGGFANDPEY